MITFIIIDYYWCHININIVVRSSTESFWYSTTGVLEFCARLRQKFLPNTPEQDQAKKYDIVQVLTCILIYIYTA